MCRISTIILANSDSDFHGSFNLHYFLYISKFKMLIINHLNVNIYCFDILNFGVLNVIIQPSI